MRAGERFKPRGPTLDNQTLEHRNRPASAQIVSDAARAFFGNHLTTNAGLREHHSHGGYIQPPVVPDAVTFIEPLDEAARGA